METWLIGFSVELIMFGAPGVGIIVQVYLLADSMAIDWPCLVFSYFISCDIWPLG